MIFSLGVVAACAVTDDIDTTNSVVLDTPAVAEAVNHDTSMPLKMIKPAERFAGHHVVHEVKPLPRPGQAAVNSAQLDEEDVLQNSPLLDPEQPTSVLDFDGIGDGVDGFSVNSAPPDTNGDVGGDYFMQIVNTDIAVFNKTTGAVVYGPVPTNTLWSGFGGNCASDNDGDGVVLYDPIAQRWVVSQFAVSNPGGHYLQCVAVSATGDPTGAWNRYSFDYGNSFPDYPKMGVWPDAYYVTFNMFNSSGTAFLGGRVCAYDRSKMLTGDPATQVCFNPSDAGSAAGGLLPADLDGANLPPAGSPNYVLALGNNNNQLAFYKFHADFVNTSNSTLTGPTDINVASFNAACGGGTCIPQSGTSTTLDSLADRLMFRLAYRNLGDHESLLVSHAVNAGSSTGIRWYELRVSGGVPSLYQQATYAPDSKYRWMSSLAMDQVGIIALGYSVSSSSTHPGLHYTGRLAGDALGTMTQGENTILDGAGSQTGSLSRWGDYASMSVDPSDDCTFVFTSEYIPTNGSFNWKTRAGWFTLPGCGGQQSNDFSLSASPTMLSVVQGNSGTVDISTAVTSGSAQSIGLTISGLPSGTTAQFNPSSVTAGAGSTLTLNVGAGAATGSYTLHITGTAASGAHSVDVTLTVTPVTTSNDFSIAASPSSVTITQGASGTTTIATAVTSGNAETVALSTGSLPAGISASLAPTSVTAGGSATLTISASASAAAGSYTVTVTGQSASATHSTNVSLTVNTGGGGGGGGGGGEIVNGGFESGSLDGWTATGTTTASTGGAHSGSYGATLGLYGPGTDTSSIAQTFTAPSAGGTLSFWYRVHCPDTVTYDWATATLKDNDTGTTSTILGKTCTDNNTWVQATASLPAGHSVTLTLTSHDDNWPYASDGTSTDFDDVTVSGTSVPNDFSLSANPTSLSVVQGQSGAVTISTAVTSGSAESIALSVTGLPSGTTAQFAPTTVTAGGSSTLTLSVGASTAAGSYTLHVTGTTPSASHSANVSLTVTAVVTNDFSIAMTPASQTVEAGGSSVSYTVSTAVASGSAGTVNLSVSGQPSGVTATLGSSSVTAGGSTTLTVSASASAAEGTSTLTVTGAESGTTHSASATLQVTQTPPPGNVLQNGVPVTGLSGATNSQTTFTLAVPSGQSSLQFVINGGTGDADLYVKFGSAPTLSSYDCRPYISGNSESCNFSNPSAGTWYVMLVGYTSYSGVSLTGTYASGGGDGVTVLVNGVPVTGIFGTWGSTQFWKIATPAGARLVVSISGGTGDADLYTRFGAKPTTSSYDCRPYLYGNNESCTYSNTSAGYYYVMIRGYQSYSGVTLKGSF